MRNFFSCLILLLLPAFQPACNGQSFLGLSGGGGLPDQVVFRGAVPWEWSLQEWFSIQPELAFVQRENLSILPLLPASRQYVLPVISYLEQPLSAKLNLDLQVFGIYALVGPKVGIATGLWSTYWEDNVLYREKLAPDVFLERLDFGLNLGAGVEKVISNDRKIFVEARYYLGFFNIAKQEEGEAFNEGKLFNLGFKVPLR